MRKRPLIATVRNPYHRPTKKHEDKTKYSRNREKHLIRKNGDDNSS